MNSTITQMLKTLACGAALSTVLAGVAANAQPMPGPGPGYAPAPAPEPVVTEGYPPPEYIATTQPVYFEGRPAYFWNGRWYYRMGNGWGFYREEPVFLRDWRARNRPPPPRFYEGRYPHGFRHR